MNNLIFGVKSQGKHWSFSFNKLLCYRDNITEWTGRCQNIVCVCLCVCVPHRWSHQPSGCVSCCEIINGRQMKGNAICSQWSELTSTADGKWKAHHRIGLEARLPCLRASFPLCFMYSNAHSTEYCMLTTDRMTCRVCCIMFLCAACHQQMKLQLFSDSVTIQPTVIVQFKWFMLWSGYFSPFLYLALSFSSSLAHSPSPHFSR